MTRIKALVLTALLFPCSLVVATYGQAQTTKADLLKIDKGFKTFTQETWNGNGRTCGTCHRPDESYNIFPSTIKTLSKSEQALVFATNVPGLENMDLVKSHAVFNVEADTPCSSTDPLCWRLYGKPGPTFRST